MTSAFHSHERMEAQNKGDIMKKESQWSFLNRLSLSLLLSFCSIGLVLLISSIWNKDPIDYVAVFVCWLFISLISTLGSYLPTMKQIFPPKR